MSQRLRRIVSMPATTTFSAAFCTKPPILSAQHPVDFDAGDPQRLLPEPHDPHPLR